MSDNLIEYENKMANGIKNFKSELEGIRAGRANPKMLDKIFVDCYGTRMILNQVANINIPEARTIVIVPYDINLLKEIEKAIQSSNLGVNPVNDGKVLRIVLPPLSEERRRELTKEVNKKSEEAKICIRNIRREAIDFYKKAKKKNEITEDDLKEIENEIQKLTDKYIFEIDKLLLSKNKEIMTV